MMCKKCGYERKPEDQGPDYACPRCGVVYAKIEEKLKREEEISRKDKAKEDDKKETVRRQVEKIRKYASEGLADAEICQKLEIQREVNLIHGIAFWTPNDVAEIRKNFKIERQQPRQKDEPTKRAHQDAGERKNGSNLISCEDCGRSVSKRASTCPHCGAPITQLRETKAIGTQLTTIQQTAKSLKAEIIMAVVMIVVGVLLISLSDTGMAMAGIALAVSGFIWYVAAKIRVWWHHG